MDYAVAALLVEQGHEVAGLTRSDSSPLPNGVHRIRDDLATPEILPEAVAQVTGRPVTRRHAPAAAEPQELLADSKLIHTELGWRPERSSLRHIITDAWSALTSK